MSVRNVFVLLWTENYNWQLTSRTGCRDRCTMIGHPPGFKSKSRRHQRGIPVSKLIQKQECIPVGYVPPACCPYLPACTAPGGVPAQGSVPARGVYLPGGCTCPGECTYPGGVPARGYLPGGCFEVLVGWHYSATADFDFENYQTKDQQQTLDEQFSKASEASVHVQSCAGNNAHFYRGRRTQV